MVNMDYVDKCEEWMGRQLLPMTASEVQCQVDGGHWELLNEAPDKEAYWVHPLYQHYVLVAKHINGQWFEVVS